MGKDKGRRGYNPPPPRWGGEGWPDIGGGITMGGVHPEVPPGTLPLMAAPPPPRSSESLKAPDPAPSRLLDPAAKSPRRADPRFSVPTPTPLSKRPGRPEPATPRAVSHAFQPSLGALDPHAVRTQLAPTPVKPEPGRQRKRKLLASDEPTLARKRGRAAVCAGVGASRCGAQGAERGGGRAHRPPPPHFQTPLPPSPFAELVPRPANKS